MRVLGLETSSPVGSVALLDSGRVVASAQQEAAGSLAERVVPLLHGVLASAGWSPVDIERIAVGLGPGSFTGLRVGLALAAGLGVGLGVPVVGVCSLAAIAHSATLPPEVVRVVVLDARRAEVFCGAYDAESSTVVEPRAVSLVEFPLWLAALGEPRALLGQGASLVGAEPGSAHRPLPHAVDVAAIGARLAPAQAPPEPRYVRDAGATPQTLPTAPWSR